MKTFTVVLHRQTTTTTAPKQQDRKQKKSNKNYYVLEKCVYQNKIFCIASFIIHLSCQKLVVSIQVFSSATRVKHVFDREWKIVCRNNKFSYFSWYSFPLTFFSRPVHTPIHFFLHKLIIIFYFWYFVFSECVCIYAHLVKKEMNNCVNQARKECKWKGIPGKILYEHLL